MAISLKIGLSTPDLEEIRTDGHERWQMLWRYLALVRRLLDVWREGQVLHHSLRQSLHQSFYQVPEPFVRELPRLKQKLKLLHLIYRCLDASLHVRRGSQLTPSTSQQRTHPTLVWAITLRWLEQVSPSYNPTSGGRLKVLPTKNSGIMGSRLGVYSKIIFSMMKP